MPPDRDSFKQHCLRAHLQAYEWRNAALAQSLSASEFGWKLIDDILQPVAHTINALPEGLTFSETVPDEKMMKTLTKIYHVMTVVTQMMMTITIQTKNVAMMNP